MTDPARGSVSWTRVVSRSIRIGVVVLVISVALGLAAFAAASSYAQYGAVRNEPNAHAWGGLSPRFAERSACASCHEPEADIQAASAHVDVSCENCHGPLAAHAVSDAAAREHAPAEAKSETCAACHAAGVGRPAAFAQVDLTMHYAGEPCLRCHDPHSIVAVRPPTVTHPLTNLPECTTCHAPDGLKKVPTGHEMVADAICLTCHGQSANLKP